MRTSLAHGEALKSTGTSLARLVYELSQIGAMHTFNHG